jgi:hypothetical protein
MIRPCIFGGVFAAFLGSCAAPPTPAGNPSAASDHTPEYLTQGLLPSTMFGRWSNENVVLDLNVDRTFALQITGISSELERAISGRSTRGRWRPHGNGEARAWEEDPAFALLTIDGSTVRGDLCVMAGSVDGEPCLYLPQAILTKKMSCTTSAGATSCSATAAPD